MRRGTRAVAGGILAASGALAGCGGAPPDQGAPGPLELVEAPAPQAAPGAGMPSVAADEDAFYLTWTEPTSETGPGGRAVHAVRLAILPHAPYHTGGGSGGEAAWSAPRTLAASDRFFVNWADFPSVATAGEGRLAAHWLARSGEGTYDYDVVVTTSTDGGERWSEPRVMHADGVQAEHGFLSFFPREEGFGAVWLDGRHTVGGHGSGNAGEGGAMTLRAGLLTWDGEPHDLTEVDGRICDCCQTGAAVTDGGVVAVYRGRTAEEVRDILAVRLENGAWDAPAPVHDDGWVIPACPVNGPAVSARGDRVATAWFTGAHDEARVRLAFSADGGHQWSAPVEVDEGAPLGRVDVVLLEDGSAVVVWLEAGEEDAALLARRVSPGGAEGALVGPPVQLATTGAARASGFPRMAAGPGERILVAWAEPGAARGEPSTLRTAWIETGRLR
jgi:hypothetical protein